MQMMKKTMQSMELTMQSMEKTMQGKIMDYKKVWQTKAIFYFGYNTFYIFKNPKNPLYHASMERIEIFYM